MKALASTSQANDARGVPISGDETVTGAGEVPRASQGQSSKPKRDTSIGTKNEIFGIGMKKELDLMKALCPTGHPRRL
jgi:hypothetical protein